MKTMHPVAAVAVDRHRLPLIPGDEVAVEDQPYTVTGGQAEFVEVTTPAGDVKTVAPELVRFVNGGPLVVRLSVVVADYVSERASEELRTVLDDAPRPPRARPFNVSLSRSQAVELRTLTVSMMVEAGFREDYDSQTVLAARRALVQLGWWQA